MQQQVDEVVGRGPVTVEHLSKLPYIEACLRETLRLTPTATRITLQPKPTSTGDPIIIGKQYEVKIGQPVTAILQKVHRDPLVFGDDAGVFKPERMEEEPFSKLPPNSWKPFGNGMRGCIGRPFAWQESLLTVALLFQNFEFRLDDPQYQLEIKQTLTIKPKGFFMHANLRKHIDLLYLEKMLHVNTADTNTVPEQDSKHEKIPTSGLAYKPLTILYGSNSGTCEALAANLSREACGRRFSVKVDTLDSSVNSLPTDHPVILICSSYEGQPPDNASHFVHWLETLGGGNKLTGISFAVFGCGNRM